MDIWTKKRRPVTRAFRNGEVAPFDKRVRRMPELVAFAVAGADTADVAAIALADAGNVAAVAVEETAAASDNNKQNEQNQNDADIIINAAYLTYITH